MNRKTRILGCIFAITVLLGAVSVPAQEVEFNYNGRVKVNGLMFSGQGQFKFALVSKDGEATFWTNDGLTTSTAMPTATVTVDVTDGFFSVNIGDTSLPGMALLEASIFNRTDKIYLRTWFSDGQRGFEQLAPDRQIVNAVLLGGHSRKETDLYVNPAKGNDTYTGLKPNSPKKTIQAAWKSLPLMLETTATIHLADGIYREEVRMRGRTIIGEGQIRIVGNVEHPEAVRVTGAMADQDTNPVLNTAFYISDEKDMVIEGIRFDYCKDMAIFVDNFSRVTIRHCQLLNNFRGIYTLNSCTLDISNVEFEGQSKLIEQSYGLASWAFCTLTVTDCTFSGLQYGTSVGQAHIRFLGQNRFSDCAFGVAIGPLSFGSFYPPWALFENDNNGVYVYMNSCVNYPRSNIFTGCSTNVAILSGSQVHE
jgi:hypothetical protein